MFVPIVTPRRGACRSRKARGYSAAITAGVMAAVLSSTHNGIRRVPMAQQWMLWTALGIVVAFVLYRIVHGALSPEVPTETSAPDDGRMDAHERRQLSVHIVAGLVAALIGLGLFLALSPRVANSQEAPTQSAFVLTRGSDTIVVERISRSSTSISGDLTMKGQARMTFVAEVAAGPFVPSMSFRAWGAGASLDSPPMQSGTQTMTADSAFITVTTPSGERKVSKAITGRPLPLLNNEFAFIELAVQRAKAQGGKATVPMFAISGGVQLDCIIEFVGKDTVSFKVAGQETRFGVDAAGRLTGGALPSQNVIITRVDGPAVDKISIGRPDYSAPAGAPYTAEEVTVKTPMGHVLTGTLTVPSKAKGKVPAVVTITGSGQEDRDEYLPLVPGYRIFRQVADTLGRRGIAVLRMDDRAINGSGGDLLKATSADFADDIRAGIAFLRARSEIDGARIAVLGHSEGGMIGPLVASTDPKIAAVVVMAGPAYTGRRIIDFQYKNMVMNNPAVPATAKDSSLKAAMAEFDSTTAKVPWMKYFLEYDPVPTAKKVKAPVLIMQGATDQQVTPDQAPVLEQAIKAGGNKDVTLKVFKDRNHLFLNDPNGYPGGYVKLTNGKIDGEVMGTLADWLATRLKP